MSTTIRCDLCRKELARGEKANIITLAEKGGFLASAIVPKRKGEICEKCTKAVNQCLDRLRGGE